MAVTHCFFCPLSYEKDFKPSFTQCISVWIKSVIETFHNCNLEISTFNVYMCQHLLTVEPHLDTEDSTFTINDIYFLYAWKPISSMI